MSAFLPVLAYQKIGRAAQNSHLKSQWCSAHRLEKQIAALLKYGYTFITPPDLQKELPQKPILLTFFGGYQSFYTTVFPLLEKHKICATLFVCTEAIGIYNKWQDPHEEPWQNIVTKKELQEMYQSGRVQVGPLGLDGHNLLEDEPDQAQQTVREAVYRLKTLHKIETCALGFWPGTPWNRGRAQHLTHGLSLPVFTSQKGLNPRTENRFLRVLHPGLFTQFLLWKNK